MTGPSTYDRDARPDSNGADGVASGRCVVEVIVRVNRLRGVSASTRARAKRLLESNIHAVVATRVILHMKLLPR